MPSGVNQAIIAIWVTIGLSVISALINRLLGELSVEKFIIYILLCALFCIFPYKLAKGSNPTRWIYTILIVSSILLMLGGVGTDMPKLDMIVSIVVLPIEVFAIFRLFQSEASSWFYK
ncbi:hypothetical protein ACMC56_06820 [Campylobacterota bacterium DY0563]|uniref:hypothetical protein n=1 Tax=Halarcobacter sp. TaxID=2321133 RepID=UPI0029F4CD84|nr:hypothetical protein [Halarcobacter sp.]